MKVNLVIPSNPFLGDDLRNPPLGLLYIAAVTRNAGHEVNITDLRGNKRIEDFNLDYDIHGFTSSTPDYNQVVNLANKIKLENKNTLTVLGGVHATVLPRSIDSVFDKVVMGEGENSFLDILKNKNNQRYYSSELIKDINSIPFPARDLLDYESAFSKNAFSVGGDYTGTIISSRGCPGDCSFCGSGNIWGKKVRFRKPENVVDELKEMKENGINHFKFYDDTMVLGAKRLEKLCELMKPLDIKWKAATRADYSDLDKLKLMKESGCVEIAVGVESLDQDTLNRNQKRTTLNQVYESVKNVKNAGLELRTYFIIGLPGEKPNFSDRLEKFIDEYQPDAVDLSTFVPFPGSPIYANPENWGISIKSSEFEKYVMTIGLKKEDSKKLTFNHDILTDKEIQSEREKSLQIIRDRRMVKNL